MKKSIILIVLILLLTSSCKKDDYINLLKLEDTNNLTIARDKKLEESSIKRVYFIKDKAGDIKELLLVIEEMGFKDYITMQLTVSYHNEEITNLHILNHNETYNYGGYLTEEWFTQRFISMAYDEKLQLVKKFNYNSNEIVTITGATITSQAVVDGVNKGLEKFTEIIRRDGK